MSQGCLANHGQNNDELCKAPERLRAGLQTYPTEPMTQIRSFPRFRLFLSGPSPPPPPALHVWLPFNRTSRNRKQTAGAPVSHGRRPGTAAGQGAAERGPEAPPLQKVVLRGEPPRPPESFLAWGKAPRRGERAAPQGLLRASLGKKPSIQPAGQLRLSQSGAQKRQLRIWLLGPGRAGPGCEAFSSRAFASEGPGALAEGFPGTSARPAPQLSVPRIGGRHVAGPLPGTHRHRATLATSAAAVRLAAVSSAAGQAAWRGAQPPFQPLLPQLQQQPRRSLAPSLASQPAKRPASSSSSSSSFPRAAQLRSSSSRGDVAAAAAASSSRYLYPGLAVH